jgi:hypothetical protein
MFDLEQSIAQWRQQMLAAGIKSPVPLEELESHLRDEIERQTQSGASEQEAFQQTVLEIGQANELKAEFVKNNSVFLSLLGDNKFTAISRIVGTFSIISNSWGAIMVSFAVIFRPIPANDGQGLRYMGLTLLAIYGIGILGGILVIRGKKLGRRIVGTMAGLETLTNLLMLLRLTPTIPQLSLLNVGIYTAVYGIITWLMFLPSFPGVKPARQ